MKRTISLILCILTSLLIFSGCSGKSADEKEFRREFYSMDTVVVVRILDTSGMTDEEGEALLDEAEGAFEDIASHVTRFPKTDAEKAESEIWTINENAGVAPVPVSDEVWNLITASLRYGELTDGRFNIVMGAISDLWGFSTQEYRVPSDEEIAKTLELCRLSDVELNEAEHTVYLKKPGMKMDLGAVSKGYATDVMASLLRDRGVTSAIIDAGGNIGTVGTKPDGSEWVVGIQHPRNESDIAGKAAVSDEYVVSSGDYQRYFEQDGVRYCHIFDPATGRPINGAAASTIICDDGMTADILSTSFIIMGETDAEAFTKENEEFSGLSWMLIYADDDGLEYCESEAMDGRFEET